MRIDDRSMDRNYGVQQISKPYTLQEDKEMKGFTLQVIAYVCEVVCDVVFSKPAPNAKYWLTPMHKEDQDITVQLK